VKRHGEHAPFFLYVRLSLPLAVAAHTVFYLISGFLPVDLTFATVPTAYGRMVLRVEPHSASSRITVYFESNHILLVLELGYHWLRHISQKLWFCIVVPPKRDIEETVLRAECRCQSSRQKKQQPENSSPAAVVIYLLPIDIQMLSTSVRSSTQKCVSIQFHALYITLEESAESALDVTIQSFHTFFPFSNFLGLNTFAFSLFFRLT
jgi:hypothetical protein